MTQFTLHTEETAPEASKPLLAKSKKAYGVIPGLHVVMAEAPGLLEAYRMAHDLFASSSFDKLEVILGVSQKVMSNYTNHLANTPVDAAFRKLEWEKAA